MTYKITKTPLTVADTLRDEPRNKIIIKVHPEPKEISIFKGEKK